MMCVSFGWDCVERQERRVVLTAEADAEADKATNSGNRKCILQYGYLMEIGRSL